MGSDTVVESHIPCPCGKSSDAYTVYEDHGFCFSCQKRFTQGSEGSGHTSKRRKRMSGGKDLIDFDRYVALESRGIPKEICQKYGYFTAKVRGQRVQVAPYEDQRGETVAQKVRTKDKKFWSTGDFDIDELQLFGQRLARTGGKRIVVTEGEVDALAARHMLGSWPAVSLPSGAGSAVQSFKTNLEFLESYDMVVICFDMDKEGKENARKAAEVLSPGKARIMSIPLKDAGEMLEENRVKEFVSAFYEATPYEPAEIVDGSTLWDVVSTLPEMGQPYPWSGLTNKLYGQRGGELVTWTAGSGVGKSEFCAEVAYDLLTAQGERVGYMALEENLRRSGQRMMAKWLDKPIHLPGQEVSQDQMYEAFQNTTGNGRFFLYDHFGSQDIHQLLSKVRFLIKARNVDAVIIDHLSILISGNDTDDERRSIDVTMTALRSLVEETGVKMHLVSHLRRPKGDKGHEQGAEIDASQLRGSHSIVHLSDAVIGLERDKSDEEKKDLTLIRVIKNRYSGDEGPAAVVKYDKETGRLVEQPLSAYTGEDDSMDLLEEHDDF